ncbi:MAG: cache domain-containing protein, partial [Candidatus Sumerlaeota bacterium]
DEKVTAFFNINRTYYQAAQKENVPEAVTKQIEKTRKNFDKYYIANYFAFYDMLFIDTEGRVFYTLRKEDDIYRNLLQPTGAPSPLGKCIAEKPRKETFVDFHDYGPSRAPAAFFVQPVRKDNKIIGWMALQLAINKVNSLFTSADNLGQTGEVFLVNQNGYMLTDSNFDGDSSILQRHLADKNIRAKFKTRSGHRTVIDYRGAVALSSFEVLDFKGAAWLVVAKIDKAEVTTDHFKQHPKFYSQRLVEYFKNARTPTLTPCKNHEHQTALRVDMDEFLKAKKGETLETFGVSTCTGVLAAYPGRFGYLAHISPHDRLYGDTNTDLLGQMTDNIKKFHIYPFEQRNLIFVIVSPHQNTLVPALRRLVDQGFLLSQIRFVHNPEAESAAMLYQYTSNNLCVIWKTADGRRGEQHHCLEKLRDVGAIVEEIMQQEDIETQIENTPPA